MASRIRHAASRLAIAVVFLTALSGVAQATWWVHDPATPGDWADAANWDRGLPDRYNDAFVDNGGTVQIVSAVGSIEGLYVGVYNTGTVQQLGGVLPISWSYPDGVLLGVHAGAVGRYELHGGELQLSGYGGDLTLGQEGEGHFLQTGGTCAVHNRVKLGDFRGAHGTYTLSGPGSLQASAILIGRAEASGVFTQTDGSVALSGALLVGSAAQASGTYLLGGGTLTAGRAEIGGPAGWGASGLIRQTAGTATLGELQIGATGRFDLTGGTLTLTGYLALDGLLDFAGQASTLMGDSGAMLDFTGGTLANTHSAVVDMAAGSLAIFPAGFDPHSEFSSYTSAGITHEAGTTLVIPAGEFLMFGGAFDDHIRCGGTLLTPVDGSLDLGGGVEVLATGAVDLGNGDLLVEDTLSGISGGRLVAVNETIGQTGVGRFVHDGGNNTVKDELILGESRNAEGTYELHDGTLSVHQTHIGDLGRGTFVQTGGRHTTDWMVSLGYDYRWAYGEYHLSGGLMESRLVTIRSGHVGQTGGSMRVVESLVVGSDSVGSYSMSGGELSAALLRLSYNSGRGEFDQTGGRVTAGTLWIYRGSSAGGYEMSGASEIEAGDMIVTNGQSRPSAMVQHGGTVNVTGRLYVGKEISSGVYELHAGMLDTAEVSLGGTEWGHSFEGVGKVLQTGGTHTTDYINVLGDSTYALSTGTLAVTDGAEVLGTVDFTGGGGVIVGGGLLDFSQTSLVAPGAGSMRLQANSLAVFPAGFDPPTDFGTFVNNGTWTEVGGSASIAAGHVVRGRGRFVGHLDCAGALTASAGNDITIEGGLDVLDGGSVDLGSGELFVTDERSGLGDGQIRSAKTYVGSATGARFHQRGAASAVVGVAGIGSLVVGHEAGTTGTYVHSGGLNQVDITLGRDLGSEGHYLLSGDGEVFASQQTIGGAGVGRFVQTGGINTANYSLSVSRSAGGGGTGVYEISGGELRVGTRLFVGESGSGHVRQTGGKVLIGDGGLALLYMAWGGREPSTYELAGGELRSLGSSSNDHEIIGTYGSAIFRQTGGYHYARNIMLGSNASAYGEYVISSGTLNVTWRGLDVGVRGTGRFVQTGGATILEGSMRFGTDGGQGSCEFSGGSFSAANLSLGGSGQAELDISGADAEITVRDSFQLGDNGTFRAVPGAAIHVIGSSVRIHSRDETAVAGLANLELVFENGVAGWATLEVAGADEGLTPGGFTANFVLGHLHVGGQVPGLVRLVDLFDNGNRSSAEALYVHDLTVGPGSTLDLNGLNLYYDGAFVQDGDVIGGTPIPEPATLALLGVGAIGLIRRRRPRKRGLGGTRKAHAQAHALT